MTSPYSRMAANDLNAGMMRIIRDHCITVRENGRILERPDNEPFSRELARFERLADAINDVLAMQHDD